MFLSYVSSRGHTLLDRELYLPKSWTDDQERCREAHVPPEVTFATKPELAWRMLERTLDSGLSVAWVVGDTVYGSHRPLRARLEARSQAYALAVACKEQVEVQGKLQRVDQVVRELTANDWQRLSAGAGSKGSRLFDWGFVEIAGPEKEEWKHWLVIRRSLVSGAEPADVAYFLVFAPHFTTLDEMVTAIGSRWTVEQCFEEGKGGVGLDEYEVRSFHGWYRCITLSMLALAFLAALRVLEEAALKKSLSRHSRRRSRKPLTLVNHMCLLTYRSWFPSALPKSGGFSFVSSTHHLALFPITSPGHSGDARIKLSHGFAITNAEAFSPAIYNCRTKNNQEKNVHWARDTVAQWIEHRLLVDTKLPTPLLYESVQV